MALTGLLGITYGVVGVIVGLLFDRQTGVYMMLLIPLVDVLLFQNPLASDIPDWTVYLPGHHVTAAMFETAFTDSLGLKTILGAIGYATALVALSLVAFHYSTAVES